MGLDMKKKRESRKFHYESTLDFIIRNLWSTNMPTFRWNFGFVLYGEICKNNMNHTLTTTLSTFLQGPFLIFWLEYWTGISFSTMYNLFNNLFAFPTGSVRPLKWINNYDFIQWFCRHSFLLPAINLRHAIYTFSRQNLMNHFLSWAGSGF